MAAQPDASRDRLLVAALDLVASQRDELLGPTRAVAAARLDESLQDIRSAFDYAITSSPDRAVMLIAPAWRYWLESGNAREASDRLRFVLDDGNLGDSAKAWAFAALAGLTHAGEGLAAAEPTALEAIRFARRAGDAAAELEALPAATLAAISTGRISRAIALSLGAARLARRTHDRKALVRALATLGIAYGNAGQMDPAERYLRMAVAEARANGDTLNEGIQLLNLATLRVDHGRPREALRSATAAAAVLAGADRGYYRMCALFIEAQALADLGRLHDAGATFLMAAEIGAALEVADATAELLVRSVSYLLRIGAPDMALRALRAGQTHLARTVVDKTPRHVLRAEQELSAAAPRIGSRRLEVADRAAADLGAVQEELLSLLRRPTSGPRPVEGKAFVFTRRETEVARLLGRGWSDRQIAAELGISEKTASVHVSNIKGKLGVASRVEAALAGRALESVAP